MGVPALFSKELFPVLCKLSARGEVASGILHARASEVEVVDFPDGAFDVDTAADYQELLRRERSGRRRDPGP